MQPIPTQGPHNPQGHTEEEVRRALHAVDGSQRWSFRYELLTSTNTKIRDLDEVEEDSGQVTLNNLGDIKRDLRLRLRDGTGIDWGSQRIKPWARLHLPPHGADDWVEWPLGVFLPETPTRTADSTSTVWRDIQAYDQGVVLADDQIPTRYSTAGHLDVIDHFLRDVSGSWGWPDVGPQWAHSGITGTTYAVTSSDGGYASVTMASSSNVVRVCTPYRRYRDGEVFVRVAADQMATGGAMLPSALLRWTAAGSFYRLRLHLNPDGTVWASVTNGTTQVGATEDTGLTYTPGGWLNIRARLVGQDVMGKVWADGAPEPEGWLVERTVDSAALAEGLFGVSASTFAGNTNTNPQLRYGEFTLDANPTNLVTGHVRRVLEQAGIVQHDITPSDAVVPTVREWEPGTTRAAIIADLLASINYRSLSFDENGVAVCSPYVPPGERAVEFAYRDDSRSIMLPDATQELDLYAVPNQWIGTVSEPDREPMTVTYTNRNPANPTSVPRRGRTIGETLPQQDAVSEPVLIEQVARIAAQSSQLYEAVEFDTALNPLHSFDDVFSVRRDDLAVDAVFTGHTWELPLAATATMRHRARRVVSLAPASDPSIVVGDATVTGALDAANIAFDEVLVTPVARVPTSHRVSGLNLAGTGPVVVILTARSSVPGTTVHEVGVSDVTPDGLTIWVYRTNTTNTAVNYFAYRRP